jgi:hypothetical protein
MTTTPRRTDRRWLPPRVPTAGLLAIVAGSCVPMPGDPGEPCHEKFGCGDQMVCVPDDGVGVCALVVEVCGKNCEAGQLCDPETKQCVTPATGCSDGATRPCGVSTGECSEGTETCAGGQWGSCEGAVGPVAEIPCDGKDNDCDGDDDDDDACTGGYADRCDGNLGLCQNNDDGPCGYLALGPEQVSSGSMCLIDEGSYDLGATPTATHVDTVLLDRFEVTNARYLEYYRSLDAPAQAEARPTCAVASDKTWTDTSQPFADWLADHPVACVTHAQAAAFCAWAGKRLPEADEWEAAARGDDGRDYPWGSYQDALANCMDSACHDVYSVDTCPEAAQATVCDDTAPVLELPEGRSAYGLFHMAGNVAEWVWDTGASQASARGGSWDDDTLAIRSWVIDARAATSRVPTVGFRCALTPPLGG